MADGQQSGSEIVLLQPGQTLVHRLGYDLGLGFTRDSGNPRTVSGTDGFVMLRATSAPFCPRHGANQSAARGSDEWPSVGSRRTSLLQWKS